MGKSIGIRQEQWLEKMGKSKDWVVWCRLGKKDEEQRPFEVDGKEILSNRSKEPNPKQERRWIRKEAKGSQFAGKCGGDRATSNARRAKSMPRVGSTKIAIGQTSKKQH